MESNIVEERLVLEAVVDQFYETAGSLFVEAYDAFYDSSWPGAGGDVPLYERIAREAGGPILELACGTGRIALPLAKAGLHVTGVDRSEAMLSIARRKLGVLPASVRERLTLVNQDMAALNSDRRFGFVFVPFHSFQHLSTIDLQTNRWKPSASIWSRAADWPFTYSILASTGWPTRISHTRGFPAPIPRPGGAMWVKLFEPNSTTSTKFAAISGVTPKSGSMARCWLRTLA
jgi:SAM-dependent methyltransferase